jgi:two-component system phosphate regulon sensor histidine kinase PhoR
MILLWFLLGPGASPGCWVLQRYWAQVRALVRLAERVEAEPELPPQIPSMFGPRAMEAAVTRMTVALQQRLADARAEERRLEAVLGGMAEGVLVVDTEAKVRLTNRRAQDLLELPPDQDCVGRPLIELTRHPDIHELIRRVRHEVHDQRTLVEEMVLDGARHQTLQVTATPLLGEADDAPQAFILVFHDVSELKHLERVRRDLVANVSHELRTPLSAIRGYSETLLTGALEDPAAARRFLSIIERHAERLGRLVDDLLTLSDLELGRTDMQRTAADPAEIVERVRGPDERQGRAGITLERVPGDVTPMLNADPDRIEQALINLVDNAIKHGGRRHGQRALAPSAALDAEGRPMVAITVTTPHRCAVGGSAALDGALLSGRQRAPVSKADGSRAGDRQAHRPGHGG